MAEPTVETNITEEDIQRSRAYYLRKAIRDHIYGPTGSVILHILIIILLVNLVVGVRKQPEADIEVTLFEPKEKTIEELKKLEEVQQTEVETPLENEMMTETPTETETPTTSPQEQLAAIDIMDAKSPLVMKGLFASRSGSGRAAALARHGGRMGGAAEKSVMKALIWLRDHQQPDGSWKEDKNCGSNNRIALTGLALLCFLAHGETHTSTNENFGVTVDKAIKYLVSQQQGDGTFGTVGPGGSNSKGIPFSYANNIAVYAMSEAFALTRIGSLRPVMENALTRVINGQQDTGAFTYEYAKNGRRDTSVTGWSAQALKAGFLAGAESPGLHESIQKCVSAFKMNFDTMSGMFRYAPEPTDPSNTSKSMTGIGVLCLQLLGHGADKEVDKGLVALGDIRPSWEKAEVGSWPMYAWYYITQAKFQKGKTTWSTWWDDFAKMMVSRQAEDGHWDPPPGNKSESEYGAVYGTTFGALTLMVPYRFLPSYQQVEAEAPPSTEGAVEDGGIQVQDEI